MIAEEIKVCRGCRETKPLTDFYKGRRCKLCVTKQNEAWRTRNPDAHRANYRRVNHRINLKKRFGLTVEQFDKLFIEFGGRCALCNNSESRDRRLSLDHCHKTGRLRGFLCSRCNLTIGNAGDDPELLRRAACYLENPAIPEGAV